MPYYVVNTGRGRSTHIMKSSTSWTPGIVSNVVTGFVKSTLCGQTATRYVDVFKPAEASCRECRRRWQVAVATEQARNERQRRREAALSPHQRARRKRHRELVTVAQGFLVLAAFIAIVVMVAIYGVSWLWH